MNMGDLMTDDADLELLRKASAGDTAALRQAFEQSSAKPRHILSVRGVGYRFVP